MSTNYSFRKTINVDSEIQNILPSPDPNVAYVITSAEFLKFDVEDEMLLPLEIEPKDIYCQSEVVDIDNEHVFFLRTNRHKFYVNEEEVANNVTSFQVHSEFLLLTTLQHSLLSIPLSKDGLEMLKKNDLTVKPWENEKSAEVTKGTVKS